MIFQNPQTTLNPRQQDPRETSQVSRFSGDLNKLALVKKEHEHLDQTSQENLQYIFNIYSGQSYYAMGSSPSIWGGLEQNIKLVRLQEFKKVFRDFGIDFRFNEIELAIRFD